MSDYDDFGSSYELDEQDEDGRQLCGDDSGVDDDGDDFGPSDDMDRMNAIAVDVSLVFPEMVFEVMPPSQIVGYAPNGECLELTACVGGWNAIWKRDGVEYAAHDAAPGLAGCYAMAAALSAKSS